MKPTPARFTAERRRKCPAHSCSHSQSRVCWAREQSLPAGPFYWPTFQLRLRVRRDDEDDDDDRFFFLFRVPKAVEYKSNGAAVSLAL